MSSHPPPNLHSQSPTGHTSLSRSTSSSSVHSTILLTPGNTSPAPGDGAAPTDLHHGTMALNEATKELAGEITKLERDCADLKARKAELELKIQELKREMVVLSAAEKKAEKECNQIRDIMEEKRTEGPELLRRFNEACFRVRAGEVVGLLLFIPVVSLGITVVAMEVALGWKVVTWGVAAVSG
ncbi:hypothetical protein VE02_08097 [Pseudogymnoascus sp. 03VT05]|nr:hypothetical protein VE02_08097 [Pseudogymnoascus sp. 03VT05]